MLRSRTNSYHAAEGEEQEPVTSAGGRAGHLRLPSITSVSVCGSLPVATLDVDSDQTGQRGR